MRSALKEIPNMSKGHDACHDDTARRGGVHHFLSEALVGSVWLRLRVSCVRSVRSDPQPSCRISGELPSPLRRKLAISCSSRILCGAPIL